MHDHEEPGRLTPTLLAMPAPHAVRAIASALLDDVHSARTRFEDDEPDALHDLRVAMRRLRSWLRAFRPELSDTVRGRTRRKLRALASATNEARDAEVALAFIRRQSGLTARTRAAVRDMADELEKVCGDHARATRRTVGKELPKTAHDLSTQLESWWEHHRLSAPASVRPMSEVFADAIRHQARRVESGLARIERSGKPDHVHRARIAAKRLRYLLEPLGEEPETVGSVDQLKSLQRLLGDVRDTHRIATRFVREIGERAARQARARALTSAGIVPDDRAEPSAPVVRRSGLTELARRAESARDAAYSEFEAAWGDAERMALVERIERIAARVAPG
ncbi:MAG: CHAD domain-containing protein [Gemmatimonadaceae bacterium]